MMFQYRFTFISVAEDDTHTHGSVPRAQSQPALNKHRTDLAADAHFAESQLSNDVAALPQRVELLKEAMHRNEFTPGAGCSEQRSAAHDGLGTSSVFRQAALSTGAQAPCHPATPRNNVACCPQQPMNSLQPGSMASSSKDGSSQDGLPATHPQASDIASTADLKGSMHRQACSSASLTPWTCQTSSSLLTLDRGSSMHSSSSLPSWDELASQRPTLSSLPDLEGNGAFHSTLDALPVLEDASRFPTSSSLPAMEEDAEPGNPASPHRSPPSLGSFGHPDLCRRECIHFARNQCTSDANCNFCHLDHSQTTRLDKKQRNVLKGLPPCVIVPFVAKLIRKRAKDRGVAAKVMQVVLILEKWATLIDATQGDYKAPSEHHVDKDTRDLHNVCKRLSISALVSIVLKMDLEQHEAATHSKHHDAGFICELRDAWHSVRLGSN
eukprot:TRINITY_DN73942_c0_g1_i1.p1 TRINITY_DN73942_c0_g1~~TRINITY_DN73942_c0_g1_i1.p1  ORF type:complete len:446 (+),score=68.00 TRINITY_DN73942_c0_g1_i1:23-1339(+)